MWDLPWVRKISLNCLNLAFLWRIAFFIGYFRQVTHQLCEVLSFGDLKLLVLWSSLSGWNHNGVRPLAFDWHKVQGAQANLIVIVLRNRLSFWLEEAMLSLSFTNHRFSVVNFERGVYWWLTLEGVSLADLHWVRVLCNIGHLLCHHWPASIELFEVLDAGERLGLMLTCGGGSVFSPRNILTDLIVRTRSRCVVLNEPQLCTFQFLLDLSDHCWWDVLLAHFKAVLAQI